MSAQELSVDEMEEGDEYVIRFYDVNNLLIDRCVSVTEKHQGPNHVKIRADGGFTEYTIINEGENVAIVEGYGPIDRIERDSV